MTTKKDAEVVKWHDKNLAEKIMTVLAGLGVLWGIGLLVAAITMPAGSGNFIFLGVLVFWTMLTYAILWLASWGIEFTRHLKAVCALHQSDLKQGRGRVYLPYESVDRHRRNPRD